MQLVQFVTDMRIGPNDVMQGGFRAALDKFGGDTIDHTKPFVVVERNGKPTFFSDFGAGFADMKTAPCKVSVAVPATDGKAYHIDLTCMEMQDYVDRYGARSPVFRTPLGGGLGVLFASVMMGIGMDGDDEGRHPDMDDPTICKPYIDALTPESTIDFIPRNYRGGDKTFKLNYQQYRHLLDVGMIDHCPVCTKDNSRLVVHEEGDHTYKSIETYLIVADKHIRELPAY